MTLAAGTRIGAYEVIAPIGAGGMGEVYRARDAKLGRDVAVKVLPHELSGDPLALSRFQREARAVAALSDPHILTIYDFGSSDGVTYAVTELLHGETLRQRLDRGGLPRKRALEVASRIAQGLAAAHETGIVHRDLKPENLFLTKDGAVKILDFGLAKQVRTGPARTSETLTDHTEAGSLLGTAAYMSPEQVRGDAADHRADVFSFGAVLYEMLTGRRAFEGETAVETMHAILKSEPRPATPPLPPALERIVLHCLEKSPADRFQSARDLAFALAAISEAPVARGAASRHSWWSRIAIVAAAAAAAALLLRRPPPAPSEPVNASLPAPDGMRIEAFYDLQSLAISPDGRSVVFGAAGPDEASWLYQRPLGGAAPAQVAGTLGGYGPFFSPDGQWIGFFGHGELRKAPLSGGEPVFLAHVPPINPGGTWGSDGRIVYSRAPNGELWWVPEAGGDPRPLTRIDTARGEQAHLFPQSLPGGAILFTVRHGRDFQEAEKSSIAVLEKSNGNHRIFLEGARMARYGGGRLVFLRGTDVYTVPFDVGRLAITGPATAVGRKIVTHPDGSFADFDISTGGTLTFLEGPPVEAHTSAVLAFDPSGKEHVIPVPKGQYSSPRLSPDGRRLALLRLADGRGDLVVYDRDRGMLTALTPEPGRYFSPVWSPDGSRMSFARFQIGNPTLCVKRADGEGDMRCLTRPSEDPAFANGWSPDGATIAYTVLHVSTSERDPTRAAFTSDIWLTGPDGQPAGRPWFEAPFKEWAATFSPDGRWIAYVSDESGDVEVFIRPAGHPGAKVKVSSDSGSEPVWSRGGRELIYRTGTNNEKFMAVEIGTTPTLTASPPRLLFTSTVDYGAGIDESRGYDVSADGNEFFATREGSTQQPERRLVIITDWSSTQPR